ncbi:MAG TPA: ThuA domain-containing protein [Isosphaeraceae bacterium]|jgi:putative heme-binding domain-containing protein|nr:ThuA domain-containing protein [Isosphaeraceae bacterium]
MRMTWLGPSALLLATLTSTVWAAVEPWADPTLPVTQGLALWLDAGRQVQAFSQNQQGMPPLISGGPLAVWYDGSGQGRRIVQRSQAAQPRWLSQSGKAAVRFDGKDDCLESIGAALALDRFSVFLVVAPRTNAGGFIGFLAGNEAARRDYDSGFTIDMGPFLSTRFESVNVEGKGFGGAVDLMTSALLLATFHTLEVHAQPGAGGVALLVDGQKQGQRDRQAGTLKIDEITLGARFYTNENAPAFLRGFLDGDIAEVLLYDHLLSNDEARAVREYLVQKHSGLTEALAPLATRSGKPLKTVAEPPPVQMLVPGFSVRALPVSLTNINNLKYRHDGKLVALAYNGNVYLLSDRDGDGLEEHVQVFWENQGRLRAPIGMALTPPGYKLGTGLFVAAKGKCSLIVDTDGDDKADREIVVAEGWKEAEHGVDALGVAVGGDGSVYFGLGTASFTNPYLLEPSGQSKFDIKSERGTILKVAPDFKSRTIVATGVRFPVALAFNKQGDLFATDQEGATWLANGNPFDELLHIQAGRHYGFPPANSKHLPGVVDEPSVFDFAPQHQSTCGLNFNEPAQHGKAFGPGWWQDDAIICGYSRGKIYRTKLCKASAGYDAQTSLVAILNMLTVDASVSPAGDLVVAAHSGGPDWGSGPDGPGKLYKVTYSGQELAQPVLAWASSPQEVRVAFDRPLEAEHLRDLARKVSIEYGRYVAAGDRFESIRPGYAVVAAQVAEPRDELPVLAASMTPDRRTLVLATAPQTEAVSYAITLPGLGRPERGAGKKGELSQDPAVDMAYSLGGIQAEWKSASGEQTWTGWLPHPDLDVAHAFTKGSAEHDRLWPLLEKPGTLVMTVRLDLHDMLRPIVQPGPRVNDERPAEVVTLTIQADRPYKVTSPVGTSSEWISRSKGQPISFSIDPKMSGSFPVVIALETGEADAPRLEVTYHTEEDGRPRAVPLARMLLPWARARTNASTASAHTLPAELAGGSWDRGRAVFFSKEAQCSSCHTVRGQGGKIGPDLTNLSQRDYASVLRDIREPSYAINPDFISYNIALHDGRVLSGTVRTENGKLHVGDRDGREILVTQSEVEDIKSLPTSTMPDGLPQLLGGTKLRDLLTFLLTTGLEPAPIHRDGAPPPRTRAEVEDVLKTSKAKPNQPPRPLQIVLVSGPKDHGVDEHDYPLFQKRWTQLLSMAENVTVTTAEGWPSDKDFASADVLVWYSANPGWSTEKGSQLDAFLARGGGMVYVHYAVNGRSTPEELARRIGLAWRDGQSRFRHGPLDLSFKSDPAHPITSGLKSLNLEDESYWALIGNPTDVDILATSTEDGEPRPLLWTRQAGKGRVFVSIPGHFNWTFDDSLFRILLLRGIAWVASEQADRLIDLATPGARLAD